MQQILVINVPSVHPVIGVGPTGQGEGVSVSPPRPREQEARRGGAGRCTGKPRRASSRLCRRRLSDLTFFSPFYDIHKINTPMHRSNLKIFSIICRFCSFSSTRFCSTDGKDPSTGKRTRRSRLKPRPHPLQRQHETFSPVYVGRDGCEKACVSKACMRKNHTAGCEHRNVIQQRWYT